MTLNSQFHTAHNDTQYAQRWYVSIDALRFGEQNEKAQAASWISDAIGRSELTNAIAHVLETGDEDCVICVDFNPANETPRDEFHYMFALLDAVRKATPHRVSIACQTNFESGTPVTHDAVNAKGQIHTGEVYEPAPYVPFQ